MTCLQFEIKHQWNSTPVDHRPINIKLSSDHDNQCVLMEVEGPFFNDPSAPSGMAGKPFPNLWDYEVVEAFFLGEQDRYLEVELCPHGQHLLLQLNGMRNMLKDELSIDFNATIDGDTWHGVAKIPMKYFPPKTTKFNAYAIHGSGDGRIYEALYPTPHGKYKEPDFHRLEYFQEESFKDIITDTPGLWNTR
uniref:UPF0462 protein C4orf33 homolog n=1 Tax=Saccoglossus kowalevskii TaxID=10224 RepID=A0ABM0GSU4_SACKO|nr:PREDICTED: UPF0462 protein C4orf33 homolog [Saccoglossus kowalevskii]